MIEPQTRPMVSARLPLTAIGDLRARCRGPVLVPGDDSYDAARQIWNGMIDRRPAVIVRCSGTADVVAAVRFAQEQDLTVAIRGGGHNVSGSALCDGGLVIDLSGLRGIHADPGSRTVRVQGGATWAEVDRETQLFGLAAPNGLVSTTGVAGLTLGGGFGALRRKYGLTCDNLISADLVTADGRIVTASETEHPDLFWAIRGGGGNFGVVTSFQFRLHPVGPFVAAARTIYSLDQAGRTIRAWRQWIATAPDEISSHFSFITVPHWPVFPPELRGQTVVVFAAVFSGDPEEGEPAVRPVREFASPLLDLSGRAPYTALQSSFDPLFPYSTRRYYWKSTFLDEVTDESIDRLIDAAARRPSPGTILIVLQMGGAISRVAPTDTAYWPRGARFSVSFDSGWDDSADDDRNIAWAREGWASFREQSDAGLYVNFAGLGEDGDALARAAYGGNYDRLARIKAEYDPTNRFRSNVNIRPA